MSTLTKETNNHYELIFCFNNLCLKKELLEVDCFLCWSAQVRMQVMVK